MKPWLAMVLMPLAACGAEAGVDGGAGPSDAAGSAAPASPAAPAADAAGDPRMPGEGGLELGACARQEDGADCTGVVGEPVRYRSLADDRGMRAIVGPQGSIMLVFLARTDGIDPGDPEQPSSTDNPSLELLLRERPGGAIIARYRGRAAFVAATESPQLEASSPLFLVVDGKLEQVVGKDLIVEGYLEDREGQLRDGQAPISVGE